MTPVLSWKRKFDGSSKGPWEGQFIEEQGGWAIVYYPRIPASQLTGGGAKPASGIRYHGLRYPLSILVYFDAQGSLMEYFCDAALPATHSGDTLEFVDLDLDLVVAPDFSAFVRDWDDFAVNCPAMGYDANAVRAAFEGIELAKRIVAERLAPFDGHAEALHRRIRSADPGEAPGDDAARL